jgi:cytochrome c oxidase subunit 2
MSIYQPDRDWFKAPHGVERVWVGLALVWCLVMFVMMPYWHLYVKQNSTGESYRVTPMAYAQRVMQFIQTNKVGELNGIPVVEPAPGGEAYLQAQMWMWFPVLKLRLNMNFQILPGYDHVLTITPTSSGEFSIVCNEFCGIGHHLMTGRIIVED